MARPKSEARCVTERCRRTKAKDHDVCVAHLWDAGADTSPSRVRTGSKPGKYGRQAGVTSFRSRTFTSMFAGRCAQCGVRFPVGELVYMAGGVVHHSSCVPHDEGGGA